MSGKNRLKGRAILNYVDNEAARFALIRGGSPTQDSAWIAAGFWRADSDLRCHSWFERVPSPSNLADGPSRGNDLRPIQLGPNLHLTPNRFPVPDNWESNFLSRWVSETRDHW